MHKTKITLTVINYIENLYRKDPPKHLISQFIDNNLKHKNICYFPITS